MGRIFGWECCNGVTQYNRNTQICCNKNVHNRGADTDCCSITIYNKNDKLCCNNILHERFGFYNACCGKSPYNAHFTSGMKCCADKEVYKEPAQICCRGGSVVLSSYKQYYPQCI